MHRLATFAVATLIVVSPVHAQEPDARQIAQERAEAEYDAPPLAEVLGLKPGGRLAIIDFVPPKGSRLPDGVPTNREGHGIPPSVLIEEMKAAGFTYVQTVDDWPPGKKGADAPFLTLFTKN